MCGSAFLSCSCFGQGKLGYRIPSIEFSEISFEDAVEFIRVKSVELDTAEQDSGKKGFNIIVRTIPEDTPPISLNLQNVTIGVALGLIAEMADMSIESDAYAVTLVPREKSARSIPANRASNSVLGKLGSIQLSNVEFSDVKFSEAIDYLRSRSRELDTDPNPLQRGVNFVIMPSPGGTDPSISLRLKDVPLADTVRYACSMSQYQPRIVGEIVKLYPPDWIPAATQPAGSR